jgi:hypothetical protein
LFTAVSISPTSVTSGSPGGLRASYPSEIIAETPCQLAGFVPIASRIAASFKLSMLMVFGIFPCATNQPTARTFLTPWFTGALSTAPKA